MALFKRPKPAEVEPPVKGIVTAVGAAGGSNRNPNIPGMGRAVEQAMADAYLQAIHDKVTDPNTQRQLMQAARKRVVAEYRAREESELRKQ